MKRELKIKSESRKRKKKEKRLTVQGKKKEERKDTREQCSLGALFSLELFSTKNRYFLLRFRLGEFF